MAKSKLQALLPPKAEEKTVKNEPVWLHLGAILLDENTQQRVGINADTVKKYAEFLEEGDEFPPIIVYQDEEGRNWLSEGWHRFKAHEKAGEEKILAEVRKGTLRDAIFHSTTGNGQHGLARTDKDKRKAVRTILADKEWSKRLKSDRAIARHCRVSHTFVAIERAAFNDPDKVGQMGDSTKSSRSMSPGKKFNEDAVPDETALALIAETPAGQDVEQQKQLAQEDPEIQFQAATLIAQGEADTVADALAQVKPSAPEQPAGKASKFVFATKEAFIKGARTALKKAGFVLFENQDEFMRAAKKAVKSA